MKFIGHEQVIQEHKCEKKHDVAIIYENKNGWKLNFLTVDIYIEFCPYCGEKLKKTETQTERIIKAFGLE